MAGKYAKVCPLKLNFAKSLYNYTESLGDVNLTDRISAQSLEQAVAKEDEEARGGGVCWCSERRRKRQAQQVSSSQCY